MRKFFVSVAAAAAAGCLMAASPALAQQAVTKECGDKWQAAKAANKTGNQTWPQFLSKCRADLAAKPAATPASSTSAGPRGMVFPTRVDPKYSKESAGVARNKTCADQYNKNKEAGGKGNGGLLYIPKDKGGQGYWPLCNAALKK